MLINRSQLLLVLSAFLIIIQGCSDQEPEQPTYFMTATINTGEGLKTFNGTYVDEVSIGVVGSGLTDISVDDVERQQSLAFTFQTKAVPDTLQIGLSVFVSYIDDLIGYAGTDGSMIISTLSSSEIAGTFKFNSTAIAPASGTASVEGSFELAAGSGYDL